MSGTTFSYTGEVVEFTVATTGLYDITAFGAQGGAGASTSGGYGAEIGGDIMLVAGEVLEIVVGGQGGADAFDDGAGGGGGGTFVIETFDGSSAVDDPLIVAGGGGGGSYASGNGYAGTTGAVNGGAGGTGGADGGGGGGGYSGGYGSYDGGQDGTTGGSNFSGGAGYGTASTGGFGGGGGGGFNYGGGGGGYGGGDGAGGGNGSDAGGGGSFDSGSNQVLVAGERAGNGFVSLQMLCYLRGTHILTPAGERFVEDLRVGDRVVTRFGGIQPVKWIGRQSYCARFVAGNPDKVPVCIRAGALGDDLPSRDLYISPGHSMLLGDQLVLARSLVNGVTITQDWSPTEIRYYQIELESHDCVAAEGAWSETFADGPGLRAQFHNAADFHCLYPAYRTPTELTLCAPRPERGPALDAALRGVVARSAAMLSPGGLEGSIDRVDGGWEIDGWAFDPDHPDLPVLLEIFLDGGVIGSVLACDFRADLLDAGKGRGQCAFFFVSPIPLRLDRLDSLRIRRARDGAEIPMGLPCRMAIQAHRGDIEATLMVA